jgi:hypothetical protein
VGAGAAACIAVATPSLIAAAVSIGGSTSATTTATKAG